jgi:hypothetical protein
MEVELTHIRIGRNTAEKKRAAMEETTRYAAETASKESEARRQKSERLKALRLQYASSKADAH